MVWEVIFPFPLNGEFAGSGMVLQGEQAMWLWEWGPFLPSFRQMGKSDVPGPMTTDAPSVVLPTMMMHPLNVRLISLYMFILYYIYVYIYISLHYYISYICILYYMYIILYVYYIICILYYMHIILYVYYIICILYVYVYYIICICICILY